MWQRPRKGPLKASVIIGISISMDVSFRASFVDAAIFHINKDKTNEYGKRVSFMVAIRWANSDKEKYIKTLPQPPDLFFFFFFFFA